MPTSAPLAYATVRKPAVKRRRLNHVLDPGRALTDNSNVAPTPNVALSLCAKPSCSTCHRALSTAIRPGVAGPLSCSRCATPTCAICARTCTSYTRPSSFPPTPALTRSPSPSTPVSPKRTALSLSHVVMNCDALPTTKRKKRPIDKPEVSDTGDLCNVGSDHHDTFTPYSVVVHGCGRVVCRGCCVESVPNDGKLCVDCFALV